MKGQITGGGKNDTLSEVLSLVQSGEILTFINVQIAGDGIRYYFA